MILLQVNCLNFKKEIYFYFTGFGTCYLHHYVEPVQQVRIFLEVVIIIMAVGFLVKVRVFSNYYSIILFYKDLPWIGYLTLLIYCCKRMNCHRHTPCNAILVTFLKPSQIQFLTFFIICRGFNKFNFCTFHQICKNLKVL